MDIGLIPRGATLEAKHTEALNGLAITLLLLCSFPAVSRCAVPLTGTTPVIDQQTADKTQHVELMIDNLHVRSSARGAKRKTPAPPPSTPSCISQGLDVASGDALTTALQPESALLVCRQALEKSCDKESVQAAVHCIDGAIAQQTALSSISAQIKVIDDALSAGRPLRARDAANSLREWYPAKCSPSETLCNTRAEVLRQRIDREIATRFYLKTSYDLREPYLARSFVRVRQAIGQLVSTGIALFWLSTKLLGAISVAGALLFVIDSVLDPPRPREDRFICNVWSIVDDGKTGAIGPVLEALNAETNPLIMPYIQSGVSGQRARGRRQLLLAPPFGDFENRGHVPPILAVWEDFLGTGPIDATFVEKLPFAENIPPLFDSQEAYDEIDLTFGTFKLAGILQPFRTFKRFRYRRWPSMRGLIEKSVDDGKNTKWAVRLICEKPLEDGHSLVASVWDESTTSEFGDTLGAVAQRAAFKLFLRILTPPIGGERRPIKHTNVG